MTKLQSLSALFVSLILVACIALGGAWLTSQGVDGWYSALHKPPFNPPNSIFGPVWTLLYAMMAFAAWRIYTRPVPSDKKKDLLTVYLMQLALNLSWSYFFFYQQNPFAALLDIIALWALVFTTCVLFKRTDKMAGLLILPYLLWVSFAAYLNAGIWWLNS